MVSPNSPLWAHAVFNVEAGVPRTIRAGLDGDEDRCDSSTALFDPRTGEIFELLEGHDEPVQDAALSPDGSRLLSVSDDGVALLYDTFTGVPAAALPAGTRSSACRKRSHPTVRNSRSEHPAVSSRCLTLDESPD